MKQGLYFLSQLTDLDVDWLMAAGKAEDVAAGTLIVEKTQPLDALCLLLAGAVRVFDPDTDTDIAQLTAGELLGEVSFVDQHPPTASVVTTEPTTLFRIPFTQLSEKLERDGAFSGRFYAMVAGFLSGRLRGLLHDGQGDTPTQNDGEANEALANARLSRLLYRLANRGAILLTGQDLTIEDVVRVARAGIEVQASTEARQILQQSRDVVERIAKGDTPVYGINTGLGALKSFRVDQSNVTEFQNNILRSHAVGVLPEYTRQIARAIIVSRLNGMARGGSGVQLAVFDRLVTFLNEDVVPVIPGRGSVGMSDLAPLAHMALPLIGDGEVCFRGERMPAGKALGALGLEPLALGPKDALSIISANSGAVGHGALATFDSINLLTNADIAAALSIEAFQANLSPLDKRTLPVRPHEGQILTTMRLSSMLEGSSRHDPDAPRALQDPISFRCVTQVHGPCHEVLSSARRTIEIELNSTGDNPVVLPAYGDIISNGNFHPAGLALAIDTVSMALAQTCSISCSRTLRLNDDTMTGLPPQLASDPGLNTGLGILQKTVTMLNAEARFLASPGSLDFMPIAGSIEDHSTMATFVVAKLEQQVRTAEYVLAIELLTAAQAIDLRDNPRLGAGTKAVHAAIREHVPFMDKDRVVADDVETVRDLIHHGTILRSASEATNTAFGVIL